MSLDLSRVQDWDIINTPVTSTDTEITFAKPIRNFVMKSRGGQTLYYRRTLSASSYVTFLPGQTIDSKILLSNAGVSAASLGYIRTDAGVTDTVETIVTFW